MPGLDSGVESCENLRKQYQFWYFDCRIMSNIRDEDDLKHTRNSLFSALGGTTEANLCARTQARYSLLCLRIVLQLHSQSGQYHQTATFLLGPQTQAGSPDAGLAGKKI